jgi:hypothetical protein
MLIGADFRAVGPAWTGSSQHVALANIDTAASTSTGLGVLATQPPGATDGSFSTVLKMLTASMQGRNDDHLALVRGFRRSVDADPNTVQVLPGVRVVGQPGQTDAAVKQVEAWLTRFPGIAQRLERAAAVSPIYIAVGSDAAKVLQPRGAGAINGNLSNDLSSRQVRPGDAQLMLFTPGNLARLDFFENEASECIARVNLGHKDASVENEAASYALSMFARQVGRIDLPWGPAEAADYLNTNLPAGRDLYMKLHEKQLALGVVAERPDPRDGPAMARDLTARLEALGLADWGVQGRLQFGYDATTGQFAAEAAPATRPSSAADGAFASVLRLHSSGGDLGAFSRTVDADPNTVQVRPGVRVVGQPGQTRAAVEQVEAWLTRLPGLAQRLERAAAVSPIYIAVGSDAAAVLGPGNAAINRSLSGDASGRVQPGDPQLMIFTPASLADLRAFENETSESIARMNLGRYGASVESEATSFVLSELAARVAMRRPDAPRSLSEAVAFVNESLPWARGIYTEGLAQHRASGTATLRPDPKDGPALAREFNARLEALGLADWGNQGRLQFRYDAATGIFQAESVAVPHRQRARPGAF